MGTWIVEWYRTKIPKQIKWAFIVTFATGLLVHLYVVTNTFFIGDTVYNLYANQNMLVSGRWALTYACGISSYFDLPWINGLLSIVYISLTAVMITLIFRIKNPIVIALIGGILATSVSTTATLMYSFTSDGYMLAMFLSAMSVYLTAFERKNRWCLIGAIACICVSCGIYQAYVSFALVLAIVYFICELLNGNRTIKECMIWIRNQIIVYAVALSSYYVIWKVLLFTTGKTATDYQGISGAGTLSFSILKNGLKQSLLTPFRHLFPLDGLKNGFSLFSFLNICLLILLIVVLVLAVWRTKLYKKPIHVVLLGIALFAIFPCSCMWHFASEEVFYYSLMLQAIYLLFVLLVLIADSFGKRLIRNIVLFFMILVICNNAIMANIGYYYMHKCYERTYAEAVEMTSQIHTYTSEYDIDSIAIIGVRSDLSAEYFDPETGKLNERGRNYAITERVNVSLLIDSVHTMLFLQGVMGLDIDSVEADHMEKLQADLRVKELECWPDRGSMCVIDDVLVIKYADVMD